MYVHHIEFVETVKTMEKQSEIGYKKNKKVREA